MEIIPFEANPEYKVTELISKGEKCLNISINIMEEIVNAAQGSFYITQMLAYETCVRSNVLETMDELKETTESYEAVKSQVMTTLARSFHSTIISFARGSKLRREGRAPYLHLLYWLSQSKNWSINADRESDRHPEQKGSVSQVIAKGFLSDLIGGSKDIQKVLHFDTNSHILIAQDPQFVYYIRNISWPNLAEEVGFISMEFPARYDFALSFAGSDRKIAEGLFEALTEMELEVFYDKNEQHRIIAEDVEEYLAPIYASDALLVICILGPDYPKRIWTKFESQQFKQRFKPGEVIPIILKSTQLGAFDRAAQVGYIDWDSDADFNAEVQRVADLLNRKCGDIRGRKAAQ